MALATVLGSLLGGCGAPPAPRQQVKGPARDDCLRDVRLDGLKGALERCDAVVAAYPRDPQPRNERALLQALAGNRVAACRDSSAAEVLLRQAAPERRGDPQLVEEIRMRAAGCRG